jgi:hypothetical protein
MPDRKPLSLQEAIRAITSTPTVHRDAEHPSHEPEHRSNANQHGAEPAKVFEDRDTPDQWRVEWFDDDGRCELEIFSGPDAKRQALRYAMRKYGHFREVQLEPASPNDDNV